MAVSVNASTGSVKRLGVLAAALLLGATGARAEEDLRNWAPDPFEQLSDAAPDCPVPRGPLMTEREWKADAHWRIETGTSCWLAGRCEDSNAYRYDAGIAASLFPRLRAAAPRLAGSSVWVYLQRRIVFLQGCVRDEAQARALEALAKAEPQVTMVVPAFRVGAQGRVPYRRLREE